MTTRRALFLCTGNYYRSRFAEEIFNHLAAGRQIDWSAHSRALAIERLDKADSVSPLVRKALSARGIVPLGCSRSPAPCSVIDLETASLIIALSSTEHRPLVRERFPAWDNHIQYWEIEDIGLMAPDEATEAIEQRVTKLVAQLPE